MSEANPDRKRWSDDPAASSADASPAGADSDAAVHRARAVKPRADLPRAPRPVTASHGATPTPVPPAAGNSTAGYPPPGASFSPDLLTPSPSTTRGSSSSADPAASSEESSADGMQPGVLDRAKAGIVAAAAMAKEKVAHVSTAATVPAPVPAAPGRAAAPAPGRRPHRTRRARLRISRIDPWSVMKTSLLFGIAGGIIFVVATYVLMSVIEATGLFGAVNTMVKDVLASPSDTTAFDITTYINTKRATGLAALIGAIDVVIFTALATVFSFLYNLSATMLGGLEITLAED